MIDKISLLLPTRQRVMGLRQYLQSALDQAVRPDMVQVVVYVDDDDPMLQQYLAFTVAFPNNVIVVQGPSEGVGKAWNVCWSKSDGDIVGMGNDDVVFKTKGWDGAIRSAFFEVEDRITCVWVNDGINGESHCAFPFVSKQWCEAVGAFTPECFHFFRHDTWLFDIAKRIGRTRYIGEVLVEHLHHSKGGTNDETTKRNRNDNQGQKDLKIWNESGTIRQKWAEKLAEVMS